MEAHDALHDAINTFYVCKHLNFEEGVCHIDPITSLGNILSLHIFGDFDDNLLNHLVLTAYKTGLTEENVKKVLNILNNADISSTGNV